MILGTIDSLPRMIFRFCFLSSNLENFEDQNSVIQFGGCTIIQLKSPRDPNSQRPVQTSMQGVWSVYVVLASASTLNVHTLTHLSRVVTLKQIGWQHV